MIHMRAYALLILFAIVLITPLALRNAVGKKAELRTDPNQLDLIIMTSNGEGIRREFAEAFSRWHEAKFGKAVAIDYRSFGSVDIVKYFDAAKDTIYRTHGTYQIDLVWGGGDYLFDQQLKRPGYLEPVKLDPKLMAAVYPKPDIGGVALYDQSVPPSWFGTCMASFGIVYNKDVVRHLGLPEPKTWRDLADPRYMGWIALVDPTRSSSGKQALMVIVERAMADAAEQGRSEDEGWADGMGLIRLIAANTRVFSEGSLLVPALVSSGDAAAGTAIDFYGRAQGDAVGESRMGYVEPVGATAINPDPIALVKGAPHRDLAIRFIEFLLGEKGQLLWNTRPGAPGGPQQTALRRLPVRPSVYADMRDFTDPVNPYTTAHGFNKSNDRERTWNIFGDLIDMSCTELLDELRETRRAILASPRRVELEARLARFPFDQKEAFRRMDLWRKATAARRLELKREWTEEFRAEYRELYRLATRH